MPKEMIELTLTGNAYEKDQIACLEIKAEDPDSLPDLIREEYENVPPLTAGDLKLYSQLDHEGRMAMRGGHTNMGYSGYYAASIYDGKGWRLFDLRTVVPGSVSNYAAQQDKPKVLTAVLNSIAQAKGRRCTWDGSGKRGMYVAAEH